MKQKKLIIFDLDGTLAESKAPLDADMATLICLLLENTKIAVISGASFEQDTTQFLAFLKCKEKFAGNLFLLPVNGSCGYSYENGAWKSMYSDGLSADEKTVITKILRATVDKFMSPDTKLYGPQIEDRGSQITFSALGQEAPLSEKAMWDPDHKKRLEIVEALEPQLPNCEISIGGATSIDITKKGINKEYGIRKISNILSIGLEDILYVGDSLFKGGNDYGAVTAGVETLAVADVGATKQFIAQYLAEYSI